MDDKLPPLDRPPLLYHSVRDAIRAYIIENKLQPGDALPAETELSRRLGISRNSVREGVKALESVGVLESRRGSGLYVKDFSFDTLLDNLPYALMSDLQDLAEMLEVRRVLETGMIGLAMESIGEEQMGRLRETIEAMQRRSVAGQLFEQQDRDFHQRLFENLDNKMLRKLLDLFWLIFRKACQHVDLEDINPIRTYRDHLAIYEAVSDRDVEAARSALDHHYDDLKGRLKRIQRERGWGDLG